MLYKQHVIERTDLRLANLGDRPSAARLYAISGAHNKPAGTRPFLISLRDAKDWINNAIEYDKPYPLRTT